VLEGYARAKPGSARGTHTLEPAPEHWGQAMKPVQGWSEINGALEREFRFKDFADALAFVNRVGELAERENHHPDIEIHWNRVRLRWWTHVTNEVTERDYQLAAKTNELET
jgi:4a-hydroxytetrahydrobiopterin dehydratase